MLLRLMIALVFSTTAARAFQAQFSPSATAALRSTSSRSTTLLRMVSSLTGKTCVSVEESLDAHGSSNTKFVDGSWFLKGRDGREEFETGPRIEGAEYFDINDISAKGVDLNPKGLPHMMPPKELFAAAMDAMGISNDDHIVLYGGKGCLTTHRAWFQIRSMGHNVDRLHLLQGNMGDWIDLGGPIEEGVKVAVKSADFDLSKQTSYQASDPRNVVDINEVLKIIEEGDSSDSVIVDVRAKERYLGQVEEPRPNMRLGHMPGALNMPFSDLLDPDDVTKFKPVEELQKLIKEAGIDITTDKRLVISCGSGATACALVAALEVCGRDPSDNFVYDGSWSEWGGQDDTPIVKE